MIRACLALVIALVLTSFLPGGHGAAPSGHPHDEHQPLVQQQAQTPFAPYFTLIQAHWEGKAWERRALEKQGLTTSRYKS